MARRAITATDFHLRSSVTRCGSLCGLVAASETWKISSPSAYHGHGRDGRTMVSAIRAGLCQTPGSAVGALVGAERKLHTR